MAITATTVATAAAVASAAATAGTAIYKGVSAHQAAQKAKGAAYRAAHPPATIGPRQRMFNEGTREILDEQRAMLENAAAQGNMLAPEVYRSLGYEPQYADAGPDLSALGDKFDAAKSEAQAARQRMADINTKLKGKGKHPNRKALEKERGRLKGSLTRLDRQAALAGTELGTAQTTGRRITGLTRLATADIPDPTGSKNGEFRAALDLESETLSRALRGEEPIDSTLQRHWEESEIATRERLRRSLGPDYAESTAGSTMLAEFAKRKGESFETFNRETIKTFSSLTESRATSLSNLTGARITQLYAPTRAQIATAGALGQSSLYRNAQDSQAAAGRGETNANAAAGEKARLEADQAKQASNDALVDLGGKAIQGGAGFAGGGSIGNLGTFIGGDKVSEEAGGVGPEYGNIISRNV